MTKTLKQRAVRSGNWVIFGYLFSQILRLGSNLILTRILVPEMFGVMAIVNVLLAGISMFSDLGISQNIIQSKHSDNKLYIDTAWTIQILRGVFIFFLIVMLSISLYYFTKHKVFIEGSVYAAPELPLVLATMSLVGLISGFNSINLALFVRDVKLKEKTLMEMLSQIVGLSVMISLAFIYSNIWALVTGCIISAFVKMMLSHLSMFGERSRFRWDKDAVKEILQFGKWIFGASIFTFLVGQGDRLILGNLITPEELGVYSIAFFFAMAFKQLVRQVMSSVLYPVLSDVARNRPNELKIIYYKIRKKVDVVIMLVVGILASSGHLIIDFLYDERYQKAGWILEILSLSSIFLGTTMAGICLLALGNSKAIMKLTATSSIFLFILVPVMHTYFGMDGAVIAIALNSIVEIPIIFYMMKRYQLLNWLNEFKFWPLFFLSYGACEYSLFYFGL